MLRQLVANQAGGCMMVMRAVEDRVEFLGSGILCHRDGYVLTCAHIMNLTDRVLVVPPQHPNEFAQRTLQRVTAIGASIAQFDPVRDIALLKIDPGPIFAVADNIFGSGENVPVGSSVGCFGFPFGNRGMHTLKVTSTIICGKSQENGVKSLHIDANLHEGNSGGSVVEVSTNKIVGIITGRFSPTGSGGVRATLADFDLGTDSTISFAVPIEYGFDLLKTDGINV